MNLKRLDEISDLVRGVSFPSGAKQFAPEKGLIPCLRTANVQDELTFDDLWYIPESSIRNENQILKEGDIVLSSANSLDLVGKSAVFQSKNYNKITFGAFLTVIRARPSANPKYLGYMLRAPQILHQFRGDSTATTNISNLSNAKLAPIEIPNPDLNIQDKIVSKIDSLFLEIDSGTKELENASKKLELYRQSVLNAAIQGKLVPQDPKDEPASKLLEKIQKEKAKLLAEKKIKKEMQLEPISDDNMPFDLPDGWIWVRLGQICTKITDGFHNTPKKVDHGITYISAVHVKDSNIDWDNAYLVGQKDHGELYFKAEPKIGEILIVNIGAGCGDSAIIDRDVEFSFKNVAILKFDQKLICNRYLHSYLLASKKKHFSEVTVGGCQPFFSLKILNNFLIPLPPLSEQKRIVEKIDSSLGFCDSFITTLENLLTDSVNLKQSVLKKAFEGEL